MGADGMRTRGLAGPAGATPAPPTPGGLPPKRRATVWWGWTAARPAPWEAGCRTSRARARPARVGGAGCRVRDRVRVQLDLEIVVLLLLIGSGGGLV